MAQAGIAYAALDNGLRSGADPTRMQALAEGLSAEKIEALVRKWLARLPQPFTAAERAAGYDYALSILQAEFALTQALDRPRTGRVFFEAAIHENLARPTPQPGLPPTRRRLSAGQSARRRARPARGGIALH